MANQNQEKKTSKHINLFREKKKTKKKVNDKVFEMMTSAADKTKVDISKLETLGHKKIFDPLLSEIYKEMPVLGRYNFAVGSVNRESEHGGSIEFMSPDEPLNPYKGITNQPYIELYADAPTERGELKKAIWGDMLHHLSDVDPYWKSLRNEYMKDRPDNVKAMDRRAYEGSGDKRSFEKWMDINRADAHIRAGLQGYSNWKDVPRTEKQEDILYKMNLYLRTGKREYK